MSFLSRIKDFFTKNQNPSHQPLVVDEPTITGIEQTMVSAEMAHPTLNNQNFTWQNIDSQASSIQKKSDLLDEDSLRDEGVIFGLSETKPDEKILAIRTYFAHQTADLEQEIGILNEKIGELNLFLEQKENRINELSEKSNSLEHSQPASHTMLRTSVGLLLSVAMCAGNYYLIDESISQSFPQNHSLIAMGVFLAGMFNLFGSTSFLHEKDSPISFRQILEEVGMPLAASVFVFVQVLEKQSFLKSFALFLFVFFLFLFAGKLLLSNLTLIKSDTVNWLNNLRLKSDKINKTKDWEEEILKLKAEIDELRVKKWQIINDLKYPETELAQLNGKRDMLIKLFESEFNLAKNYREKLTSKQIRKILE